MKEGIYWSMSLVPVQSWIASARRSRDLLAGSAILSWAAARILRSIEQRGGRVELPRLPEGLTASYDRPLGRVMAGGAYGIPNRAAGTLPLGPEDGAKLFAEGERELERGWRAVVDEVGRAAAKSHPGLWRLLRQEVEEAPCPFQLVWCVQRAAESSLEDVDRRLTAVKRSRRILPHQGAAVPKCNQCGLREAVGGKDLPTWRRFQDRLSEEPSATAGRRISSGEQLCSVCVVKRLAGYLFRSPFPSTSDLAARRWRAGVEAVESLAEPLRALKDAARKVPGYEGATADVAPFYFSRSLERERRAAVAGHDEALRAALDRVAEAQRRLQSSIRARARTTESPSPPSPEPSPYLAVLTFDGDHMAARIRNVEGLAARITEFQRDLGERLRADGSSLGRARAFYLGGDEGLLAAPIDGILETAEAIHGLWCRALEDPEPGSEPRPTLSMGVVLFDRERSLGRALEVAAAALERAKEAGRNRLSMTVLTASGNTWSTTAEWGDEWARPRKVLAQIQNGALSRGWTHDVERFLRTLPREAWTSEVSREAVRAEVERLTRRRSAGSAATWEVLGGATWWPEQPSRDVITGVADQLHLVSFLARESSGEGFHVDG